MRKSKNKKQLLKQQPLKAAEEKSEAERKAAAKKALEIHITPIEETSEIKENTSLVSGPKVLGTVDLSAINPKTKPDKKSKKESELKSEPKKNTSKDKKEVIEEPSIIEQPVLDEEKITPVDEAKEVFHETVYQKLEGPKIMGKIELPVIKVPQKTAAPTNTAIDKKKRKRIRKGKHERGRNQESRNEQAQIAKDRAKEKYGDP